MKQALPNQISDIRSQVQVEACITACFISETYPNMYPTNEIAEFIIDRLFGLLKSKTRAISTIGWASMEIYLSHSATLNTLLVLLEKRTSKADIDRQKLLESFLIIFDCWPEKLIVHPKVKENLISSISKAISDRDSEVRTMARACFKRLRRFVPKECELLERKFTDAQKRAIENETRTSGISEKHKLTLPKASSRPKSGLSSSKSGGPKFKNLARPKTAAAPSTNTNKSNNSPPKNPDTSASLLSPSKTRSSSNLSMDAVKSTRNKYANIKSKINSRASSRSRDPNQNNNSTSDNSNNMVRTGRLDRRPNLGQRSRSRQPSNSRMTDQSSGDYTMRSQTLKKQGQQLNGHSHKYQSSHLNKRGFSQPVSRNESPERQPLSLANPALAAALQTLSTPEANANANTNTNPNNTINQNKTPNSASKRKSRIPSRNNSRPASRDPSPGSYAYSQGKNAMLSSGKEAERMLANRLKGLMDRNVSDNSNRSRSDEHSQDFSKVYLESDINDILMICSKTTTTKDIGWVLVKDTYSFFF